MEILNQYCCAKPREMVELCQTMFKVGDKLKEWTPAALILPERSIVPPIMVLYEHLSIERDFHIPVVSNIPVGNRIDVGSRNHNFHGSMPVDWIENYMRRLVLPQLTVLQKDGATKAKQTVVLVDEAVSGSRILDMIAAASAALGSKYELRIISLEENRPEKSRDKRSFYSQACVSGIIERYPTPLIFTDTNVLLNRLLFDSESVGVVNDNIPAPAHIMVNVDAMNTLRQIYSLYCRIANQTHEPASNELKRFVSSTSAQMLDGVYKEKTKNRVRGWLQSFAKEIRSCNQSIEES